MLSNPEIWGAVARSVAFGLTAVSLTWFIHLIEPALSASFSPKYKGYEWVDGKRGFLQFFKVAYDVVFHAKELFITAYDKVR